MSKQLKKALTAFLDAVKAHQACGMKCKLLITGLLAVVSMWSFGPL